MQAKVCRKESRRPFSSVFGDNAGVPTTGSHLTAVIAVSHRACYSAYAAVISSTNVAERLTPHQTPTAGRAANAYALPSAFRYYATTTGTCPTLALYSARRPSAGQAVLFPVRFLCRCNFTVSQETATAKTTGLSASRASLPAPTRRRCPTLYIT